MSEIPIKSYKELLKHEGEIDKMNKTPSLRDSIKDGLGDQWTQELEDSLFWSLCKFLDGAREIAFRQGVQEGMKAFIEIKDTNVD